MCIRDRCNSRYAYCLRIVINFQQRAGAKSDFLWGDGEGALMALFVSVVGGACHIRFDSLSRIVCSVYLTERNIIECIGPRQPGG